MAAVSDDANFRFVDLWGRIHLYNASTGKVAAISPSFPAEIKPWLNQWAPLAFPFAASGQELPYVLGKSGQRFSPRPKTHHLPYGTGPRLAARRLHLYDLSDHLKTGKVVLFSGRNVNRQIEVFRTGRYGPPMVFTGATDEIK